MTLSDIEAETAKRNLARHMARFLDAAERDRRPLTAWETDRLCRVVALLQTGACHIGDEVMLQLERPDVYCTPAALAAVASGPVLKIAELRAALAEALGGA